MRNAPVERSYLTWWSYGVERIKYEEIDIIERGSVMKKGNLIIVTMILLVSVISSGCIDDESEHSVSGEYKVEILTNSNDEFEIICPIALPLFKDPMKIQDELEITEGTGAFEIIKISQEMPYYDNLSNTERKETNLYGLKIVSNSNVTIEFNVKTDRLLVMSLRDRNYFTYLNSSKNTTIEIRITAYSENGSGQDYNSEFQELNNGWQQIVILVGGWEND